MNLLQPVPGRRRPGTAAGLVTAVLAFCPGSVLAETGAAWQVAQGEVRVVCPMTIGGSFEVKTTSLTGTLAEATAHPPTFEGSLSVDLRQLDTGIGLRNDHLRDEYLEVQKGTGFDIAVLSEIRLGDVDTASFQGRTSFTGNFVLHGTKQSITGQAEVRREGARVRIQASFPVTLASYGIPKPQYLGVGVKDEVQVKVSFVAMPATTSGGLAR